MSNATRPARWLKERRSVIGRIALIVLPWIAAHIADQMPLTIPPMAVPFPLHVLLGAGILLAWKRGWPLWSYTWIGAWYFFLWRECIQIVSRSAPQMEEIFRQGFNPFALAVLLTLISRRDWLLACLTGYPYTTLIQAWWTLDTTPVLVLVVSLILYVVFLIPLLIESSRRSKFLGILVGTIVIGIGFYVFYWPGWRGFAGYVFTLLGIILYPAVIFRIRFCRRLLGVGMIEPGV